jgi:thymidine phosphorylase
LRKLFEFVGDSLGMHLEVLLTDGSQPVGRGVGPVLEARDVMAVLRNDPDAPEDLRAKALMLAGRLIELDPQVRGGAGLALATQILDSGRALAKMDAICEAQGRNLEALRPGPLRHEVAAEADGVVLGIDNLQIARVARMAGAPLDKGAGVDLLHKQGDAVQQGEALYAIHAQFPADFRFARALAGKDSGYRVGLPGRASNEGPSRGLPTWLG